MRSILGFGVPALAGEMSSCGRASKIPLIRKARTPCRLKPADVAPEAHTPKIFVIVKPRTPRRLKPGLQPHAAVQLIATLKTKKPAQGCAGFEESYALKVLAELEERWPHLPASSRSRI